MTKHRILLIAGLVVVILIITWLGIVRNCPSSGIALTRKARTLHQLKNRTTFPQTSNFDARVSLTALLEPGDDSNRWSIQSAARIEAYVIDVAYARPEATNCFSPCRRDVHINVASREGAPQSEQLVIEVTPNLQEWAARQGWDWSEETLHRQLLGHWCEFEGWLFFDVGHADQSENTAPHNPTNWRATAWEIHPITSFWVIR